MSTALRGLVLGWDRYREAIAEELGVGTTEVVALGFLYHDGPQTPTELGHRLNLTSGSITALLDRMESAAYVTRAQNPDDRRSLLVAATPAGRHTVQWFYERIDELVRDTLKGSDLSLDDLVTFARTAGESLSQRARESKEQRR